MVIFHRRNFLILKLFSLKILNFDNKYKFQISQKDQQHSKLNMKSSVTDSLQKTFSK